MKEEIVVVQFMGTGQVMRFEHVINRALDPNIRVLMLTERTQASQSLKQVQVTHLFPLENMKTWSVEERVVLT